jgi:hypothetical protein
VERAPANTVDHRSRRPAAEPDRRPRQALSDADWSPETERDLVQLMRHGPIATARRQTLQAMFGDARLGEGPGGAAPVVQRRVLSDTVGAFLKEQVGLQTAFLKGELSTAEIARGGESTTVRVSEKDPVGKQKQRVNTPELKDKREERPEEEGGKGEEKKKVNQEEEKVGEREVEKREKREKKSKKTIKTRSHKEEGGKEKKKPKKIRAKKEKEKGKEKEAEAPPRYTTVGFEHEFAQMMDGPLQGVSHLELAKSDLQMPVTELPFILETDAQNSMELVSPPFLLETLPDAPIPLPDDVRKVDGMLDLELRKATGSNGRLLGDFITRFEGAAGITFAWLADKDSKVEIERKNFSHNTSGKIETGLLGGAPKVKLQAIKNISIGPSEKGQASMGSAKPDSSPADQGPDVNTKGEVISQVNFATSAKVFEAMRQLPKGERNEDLLAGDLGALTEAFRESLISGAFSGPIADREMLIEGMRGFQKALAARVPRSVRSRSPQDNFNRGMSGLIARLQLRSLDAEQFHGLVVDFDRIVASAREELEADDPLKRRWMSIEPEPALEEGSEAAELLEGIGRIREGMGGLSVVGAGSPGLRIFLNTLARTLAGLVSVPAQSVVAAAQEKRRRGAMKAMTPENIGFEAQLTSRVKDVDQSWLKDNIVNFGMGILSPEDWRAVLALIDPDGAFQAGLATMIMKMDLSKKASLEPYLEAFILEVRRALKVLSGYILSKRLDSDRPDLADVGPKKAPEFLESHPEVIGARQDTFIHPSKVALPGQWIERLHVVESRWRSVDHVEALARAWRAANPLPGQH